MHELPWITIFWSRVGWFANDFHEWRSHEWKSLANHLTSDQKIVIHGNEFVTSENHWQITPLVTKKSLFTVTNVLFYFLHAISYLEHTIPLQTIISPLLLRTVFSYLTLWRHHSWSVTSCERESLALWRHIRRLFLYAQIGAKAIFTSE